MQRVLCTAAAVVAVALPLRAVAQPNLVANADFRQGTLKGTWQALYPGSSAIANWTIERPVDYVGTYWASSSGGRTIDMDGTPGPGAISQTLHTTPGAIYQVAFDLAGNPEGPPKVKVLDVTVGGTERKFTFDITGKTKGSMGYRRQSFTFRAPGSTTKLRFASLDEAGNWNGPVISNVSVTLAQGETSPSAAPAANPTASPAAPPQQQRRGASGGVDLNGRWSGAVGSGTVQLTIVQRGRHAIATLAGSPPAPSAQGLTWEGDVSVGHFVVLERCAPDGGKLLLYGAAVTMHDRDSFDFSKTACLGSAVHFTRVR